VIVTFYSYKGGVGRSMAVANVADLLARSGLRVLMVDFDLEAPGLEHFFPVDAAQVRARPGLLDLLLAYKYSMSLAAGHETGAFRDLDRFIGSIYPRRDGGGSLDLLAAGQRESDEQLVRYGTELRRFDWIDFYFSWSGELLFEWLRRAFDDRFDIVLVDSRTGVTEVGGICAYQLADVVVVLCGSNLQNIEGTDAMVRHFLSPKVLEARRDRPIDVLVVPARVEQRDDEQRAAFERRFVERFETHTPRRLVNGGVRLWDLQIPYEPRYAFDEQVVTDPSRAEERRQLAQAYTALLGSLAELAPDDSPVARLRRARSEVERPGGPVETRYDPKTRTAGHDVFLSYARDGGTEARRLAHLLGEKGITAFTASSDLQSGASWSGSIADAARQSKAGIVFVSAGSGRSRWVRAETEELLADAGRPILVVLQPGAEPDDVPPELRSYLWLDWRNERDDPALLTWVEQSLTTRNAPLPPPQVEVPAYVGTRAFVEADASLLFGRVSEVEAMLDQLSRLGHCCVGGPSASGKTSAVHAGLIPALRAGRVPGSELWQVAHLHPGPKPSEALTAALAPVLDVPEAEVRRAFARGDDDLFEGRGPVLLVVDQVEELYSLASAMEREEFSERIRHLVGGQLATYPLVLVARDHVLSRLATDEVLGWFGAQPVVINPLVGDPLRAAIEGPALRAGFAFEPGLVDELLRQAADEPARLPLLQAVLHRLWDDRRDGYLTWHSYRANGGMGAAITAAADSVLSELTEADQLLVRAIVLRLIVSDDDGTSRTIALEMNELLDSTVTGPAEMSRAEAVIDALCAARVLVVSMEDGRATVRIGHQLLVQSWGTLDQWIQEDRGSLRARQRLDQMASDWRTAQRSPGFLPRKEYLDEIVGAVGRDALTQPQLEYVTAAEAWARRVRRNRVWVVVVIVVSFLFTIFLVAVLSTSSTEPSYGGPADVALQARDSSRVAGQ
jgi:cellulose biosynthesis protein BcsQ